MSKSGTARLPLHGGKAPRWLFGRMEELGGAIVLAVASIIAFQHGLPLDSILLLPLRVGGESLYAASFAYRDLVGTEGSLALLKVGQWSLQLIWVYLISDIATGILESFGR